MRDWESGLPEVSERRPLWPVWLRHPVVTARWWAGEQWHRLVFHLVRVPMYVARAVAWTPGGLWRAVVWVRRWVTDAESASLRAAAVEAEDTEEYLYLVRVSRERFRARFAVTLVAAPVLAAGLVAAWSAPLGRLLVVAVTVAVGGWWGRPADRELFEHPVVSAPSAVRITPDLLVEAFCAAKLCNKHEDPERHQTVTFLAPVHRDGRGWRATLDLPGGHTASKAISRREEVAAGLGVDEVRVFLERVRGDEGSARRVSMWVADRDPYAAAPVVSPLVKAPRWNFWDGVPFGVDARGQLVDLGLLFTNLLVGAIPRMGKTYVARLPAAAAALDPVVRLIGFCGKGGADWRPVEKVAHRCGFGARDPVVAHLRGVLEECEHDMERRYDTLAGLPVDVCPESKITPGICANKRLDMPPVLICIDEVQEYLSHDVHGPRIVELLVRLAKVGPAVGYMLVIATQRPDGDTIPTALRDVLGTRFALKTMTWQSSDTILGAGSYKAGLDASKFQRSHKGVGILLGADDGELADEGPQTVRGHLLDLAGFTAICERGRQLRLAAGTLTGHAAGEQADEAPARNVLDDVAGTFGAGEDRLWSETICGRLAEDHPETYSGWGPTELANVLALHSVDTAPFWGHDDTGAGRNRRGVRRQDVLDALASRVDQPPGNAGTGPRAPRFRARDVSETETDETRAGPGQRAPDPARSRTPSSTAEQGSSGLAGVATDADSPGNGDSPPGPLGARHPEPY